MTDFFVMEECNYTYQKYPSTDGSPESDLACERNTDQNDNQMHLLSFRCAPFRKHLSQN